MLLINTFGFVLIALIVWWFWLYKAKAIDMTQNKIKVLVQDGSYQPSRISLKANQANKIEFLRKDASPCTAMVLFPDFEISQELTLNKITSIELPAMAKGEYAFHCQMQMIKGSIVVN